MMLAKTTVQPPAHLAKDTADWFKTVLADYDMQPHHIALLTLACEAYDRAQQAREILATEGVTIDSNQGCKAHPAVAIERDARIAFARLVAQLNLDVEEPVSQSTKNALRSSRAGGWRGID